MEKPHSGICRMLLATFGTIMLCRLWDRFMAQGTKMLLACPAEQVVVVSNLQSYQSKYIRGNAKELVNSSSKKITVQYRSP